jgi:aspartate aminotransferase-like enzyme
MKKSYLITPGPTPIPPEVSSKEGLPILHHRTNEFGDYFVEVLDGLKYVYQTKNDMLLISGSGTGAMESAVANLLSPGDTAIVATSGAFGDRWCKILESFGATVVAVKAEWGHAVPSADVEKALKSNPQAKAVFCQLTETSTGVVNDVRTYAKLTAASQAVLVVDAISGLGGQEMDADAWGVDVVVAGSQKGLMTAPGLAMVSVSERAWKLVEAAKNPRFYFDWRKMRKSLPEKETPWTPPVSLVVSMAEALRQIKAEGLENVFARHAWLAEATRAGVKALGLDIFAKQPCNVLTSVVVPAGVDGKKIIKKMRDDYGVSIAGGQVQLMGKIFRLAHMGYMERFDVIIALSATEMILTELGYKLELGKGIAAAERVLLSKPKPAVLPTPVAAHV